MVTSTTWMVFGRLVSVLVTEAAVEYLGRCVACEKLIELGQVAVYDWQSGALLHKADSSSCVTKYIEQYLRSYPTTTLEDLMLSFSLSRATAYRRFKGARNGTK